MSIVYIIAALVIFKASTYADSDTNSLNDYLHSYLDSFEVIDPIRVISKRSLDEDSPLHLHFNALNRSFHLVLRQAYSGTVPTWLPVQVVRNDVTRSFDASALFSDFYSGYVAGEPLSRVSGYFDTGQFHLTIDDGIDVLTLEPLSTLSGNRSSNHMLAYYDSGIKSKSSDSFCGLPDAGNVSVTLPPHQLPPHRLPRRRRAAAQPQVQQPQPRMSRACRLQLVADHTFVQRIASGSVGSTVKCLIKIVDDINAIYQASKFVHPATLEEFAGVGFELANLVVKETSEDDPNLHPAHFNARTEPSTQHTASHYLEAFGDYEQNKLEFTPYCINHLVTFRPMKQNILGLAYLGSPHVNFIGGICSPPSPSTYGRLRSIARNIGFSTYANKDGQPILSRQALLVSAHELGHNMGSEHDPVEAGICSPAWVDGGPYLMYQIAVTGNADHHSHFSECSRKQIAVVIKARLHDCFQEPRNTFCGNLRREPDEDCDAGPRGDMCCDHRCRLRPSVKCSDVNSPCCTRCQLAGSSVLCQRRSPLHPCLSDTYCTGRTDTCPPAANLADGTPCQFGVGACASGSCDSVCKQLNQQPCSCQAPADSCRVCCQPAGNRSLCSVFRHPLSGDTISLPADQPCAIGRCMSNGTCQRLELGSGQLIVRLWDLIVQSGSNSVATFLWKNIVFSVIIATLLLWVPACMIIARQDRMEARKDPSNAAMASA